VAIPQYALALNGYSAVAIAALLMLRIKAAPMFAQPFSKRRIFHCDSLRLRDATLVPAGNNLESGRWPDS
jgi:hypothetical protein